jgi:hypothetical protein
MKPFFLIFVAFFSVSAFAQGATPMIGTKPLVQVKPKGPVGCKLVGTVKGTKLWAGDCMASETVSGALEAAPTSPAQPASGPK